MGDVVFVKTGGQNFQMTTGRLDGTVSDMQTANNDLVSTKSSATELTQKFMSLGLGQDEMITLSGINLSLLFLQDGSVPSITLTSIEHYKKTVSELTETCPNHDVLIDGLLTENVRMDTFRWFSQMVSVKTIWVCHR